MGQRRQCLRNRIRDGISRLIQTLQKGLWGVRLGELALSGLVLGGLVLGGLVFSGLWVQPVEAANSQLRWLEAEPGDRSEFTRAMTPRTWQFPQDFGPHEDYQTEWWYYTGNLQSVPEVTSSPATSLPATSLPATNLPAAPSFGFQLTFFRQALLPSEPPVPPLASGQTVPRSQWRNRQIYSAHFTVSDLAKQQFYPAERFSRGTVGLAGAVAAPYQVWLENWSATEIAPGKVRLQAQTEEVAIDLVVEQTLPPILQGDRGLSIKGLEPGNASYYYSLVQQPTAGVITVKGQPYAVQGLTWKDHEYSTSALSEGVVGWDWFSMQFENGSALMLYLLRREDGTLVSTSAGTFIASDGTSQPLSSKDWSIEALKTWKSPKSGATYPAQWTITIPKLDLQLQAKPLMPNQELTMATATYWEGAVAFAGSQHQQPLRAQGYVELTGYADRLDTLLSERTP